MEEPGQAHVEDLDHAGAVDEDVARLDVAVDQPGLVGVLEADGGAGRCSGTARSDVERAGLFDDVLQAGAVHVLHDQEVQVVVLVDVVGADDVQRRHHPRCLLD